jgi:hypothetical protein
MHNLPRLVSNHNPDLLPPEYRHEPLARGCIVVLYV